MMTWPKPVQKPHPPIIVGGAFPHGARRALRYGDGWMPVGSRAGGQLTELVEKFKQLATETGRDPATVPMSIFGAASEGRDEIGQYRDLGIDRVVVSLESEKEDTILPILDRWAGLMQGIAG